MSHGQGINITIYDYVMNILNGVISLLVSLDANLLWLLPHTVQAVVCTLFECHLAKTNAVLTEHDVQFLLNVF